MNRVRLAGFTAPLAFGLGLALLAFLGKAVQEREPIPAVPELRIQPDSPGSNSGSERGDHAAVNEKGVSSSLSPMPLNPHAKIAEAGKPNIGIQSPHSGARTELPTAIRTLPGRGSGLRQRDGVFVFNSERYGATFASGSMSVGQLKSPESQIVKLTYELETVRVGEEIVARGGPAAPRAKEQDTTVWYDRGTVEERYSLLEKGVEQDFVLRALPPGKGAITVTGTVATSLTPPANGTHATKLFFGHQSEEGMQISDAVVFDAAGRRLPLEMSYSDGRVSMTVPAAWVAEATLPITIDPTFLAAVAVQTEPWNSSIGMISHAGDGTALVIWTEATGSDYNIYGHRIDATGQLLGGVISLATSVDIEAPGDLTYAPAPINKWLLCWAHQPPYPQEVSIAARLINGDGTLAGAAFTVDDVTNPDYSPQASWDGTNWYVCWMNRASETLPTKLLGRFVSSSGIPGLRADPVPTATDYLRSHDVAFSNGTYLVSWSRSNLPPGEVLAKTVSPAGAISGATLSIATSSNATSDGISVCGGTSGFLVTWSNSVAPRINGRIVSAALSNVTPSFTIEADIYASGYRAAYVPAEDRWFFIYNHYLLAESRDDIFGRYVTPQGAVGAATRVTTNGQGGGEGGTKQSGHISYHAATNRFAVGYSQGESDSLCHVYVVVSDPSSLPAPTDLVANSGNQTVSLSWTGSAGALSYKIFRKSEASADYPANPIATVGASPYNDPGLTNGTMYLYVVRASNTAGDSLPSNEAMGLPVPTPPAAPSGLAATGLDGRINLTWNAVGGAIDYVVLRSTSSAGPFEPIGPTTSTTYLDEPLANLYTYFYVVRARDSYLSESADSNQASAMPSTPSAFNLLFVAGSTSLNTSDNALKLRLEAMGYAVEVRASTTTLATSHADGKVLVVISSTSNPTNVGIKFRDVSIPVLLWEPQVYDDMKMTATTSGSFGTQNNQTTVAIDPANASHPMAAGLTGTVPVVTANRTFSWGVPSAGAIVIASVPSTPARKVIFAYDTGATMVGMNAPARRVGFFLNDTGANILHANGAALFDAAVRWATNVVSPPLTVNVGQEGGKPQVTWEEVPGAQSYTILRGSTPNNMTLLASGISGTAYVDLSAAPNTAYYYAVRTVNVGGAGATSLAAFFAQDTVVTFTVLGRSYLKTWRIPGGSPPQTVAEAWNKGDYEIKWQQAPGDLLTLVPGTATWTVPPAWASDLTFTPVGGSDTKCTITVASDLVGPGMIPITYKANFFNTVTGLTRIGVEFKFPLRVDRRAMVYLYFRWPIVKNDTAKQTQRPQPFFDANGDFLTNTGFNARRDFATEVVKWLSIFDQGGGNYLLPQAPCWDAANIDFYWDADVTYKAEPTNYIPAAAFEGNDFQSRKSLFTDSANFRRLQSYNNYLTWINVYFFRSIQPEEGATVWGQTIYADGTDKRAIVISDGPTTTLDVAITVAHELGHTFTVKHVGYDRTFLGRDVRNALINNPVFIVPPPPGGDPDYHNLMFPAATFSNAHLTEFQCLTGHKGARAHPSLRLTD